MSTNPYQSPQIPDPVLDWKPIRVDGKLLLVESGAVLPHKCIKTNQPVSPNDMVTKDLYWCSPIVVVLVLLSPLILLLVYFLIRKKCTVTYAIHPNVRRKRRVRLLIKVLVTIGLFFALPLVSSTDSTPLIVITLLLFLASFIWLCAGNSTLTPVSHRNGTFGIKGCCEEFLAEIQLIELA